MARTEGARGAAPVPADVRDEFLDDFHEEIPQRASRVPRAPRGSRPSSSRFKDPSRSRESPRSLGRTLLVLVFLLLGGAVAYAVLFMPGEGESPTKPPTEPTTKSSTPTAGQPPRTTAPSTGRPSATTAICSSAMSPRLPSVDDLHTSQAVENRLSTGWRCL